MAFVKPDYFVRLIMAARLTIGLAGLALVFFSPAPIRAGESAPTSSENKNAQRIRDWHVGAGEREPDAEQVLKILKKPGANPWLAYLRATRIEEPKEREIALRALLARRIPEALKRAVLIDIKADPAHQSREAEFIRRYGFYSNWFNRAAYVTSRALQGNLQAIAQLPVDALFDLFGRGRATPAERRLYRLLTELEREGLATRRDEAKLRSLRAEVDRALAEADLERGSWALRQGDPGLAEFYARGALARREGWGKAEELERESAAAQARRNRAAVASSQVGFPDRKPPAKISPASVARAAAADDAKALGEAAAEAERKKSFSRSSDALFAWMLADLGGGDGDRIDWLRRLARKSGAMRGPSRGYTEWTRAALLDPAFNPELRLARAEADRRQNVAAFIFFGPQTARERTYAAASRFAQAWNALSSIGIFYVFEFLYRAGLAVVKPPAPEAEALDAAAAYARAAPEREESGKLASVLADRKVEGKRFDQARAILKERGKLDEKKRKEIDKAEAGALVESASALPPGDPDRDRALKRAAELAPGTSVGKAAERELKKKPAAAERIKVTASWKSLERWTGQAAPAGLPGRAEWFDGAPENGEAAGASFTIEGQGLDPKTVAINYSTRRGGEIEALQLRAALADLPPKTADWVRHGLAERDRAKRELDRLSRMSIPYEITGGAGLSGFDFYPRLLPLESRPGETLLYSD